MICSSNYKYLYLLLNYLYLEGSLVFRIHSTVILYPLCGKDTHGTIQCSILRWHIIIYSRLDPLQLELHLLLLPGVSSKEWRYDTFGGSREMSEEIGSGTGRGQTS